MDYNLFCQWLKENKKLTERSAKDVISRCKRIQRATKTDSLSNCTLHLLTQCEEYSDYSLYIKSQLKRALVLYNEFCSLG